MLEPEHSEHGPTWDDLVTYQKLVEGRFDVQIQYHLRLYRSTKDNRCHGNAQVWAMSPARPIGEPRVVGFVAFRGDSRHYSIVAAYWAAMRDLVRRLDGMEHSAAKQHRF